MASEGCSMVLVYMRVCAAQDLLISILSWRCNIDQVHDVDMAQSASQGPLCVSSAQSLTPLGLRRVLCPGVCDIYPQAIRLLCTDSSPQCGFQSLTNRVTPHVYLKIFRLALKSCHCISRRLILVMPRTTAVVLGLVP